MMPHLTLPHSILRRFFGIMAVWTLMLIWFSAIGISTSAKAQPFGFENYVKAQLEAEAPTVSPGDKVTLAFVMTPEDGWHDYWLNPADAGTPLILEWGLPAGVTAGDIRAPVPETLMVQGFMNYIYEHPHAFLVDLTVADTVAVGTPLPITVKARWSACTDKVCVPQEDELKLDLSAGNGDIAEPDQRRFDGYRQEIPPMLDRAGHFQIAGENLKFAIPYAAAAKLSEPYFFPAVGGVIDHAAVQSARRVDDYVVITAAKSSSLKALPGQIEGLLRIGDNRGVAVQFSAGDIPGGGDEIATLGGGKVGPPQMVAAPIWITLAGAILGGLLLNLMPCVFPILGLKALSLSKLGGAESAARRDALFYSAGVILSCIVLGVMLLLLRSAGQQVGWAFQLQEPVVVLLLLLLMVAITANLAGLFEMNVAVSAGGGRQNADGDALSSFGTGVLAAIVATPCTGPFMAAALGAALLLPAPQALMLFAALGFGLALPYLLIAYIPAIRRRMPKPGIWMEKFRRIMAVPMLLTALALLWLLWRLSGVTGLMLGLTGGGALLICLAFVRHMQRSGRSSWMPAIAALTAVVIAAVILPKQAITRTEESVATGILQTEKYSDARLANYRRAGRPVFVYFTADWCVTCKVNEAAALQRKETADAFAAKNVAVLEGDWTRRDEGIARVLESYGRSGVPLYLWFAPEQEAQILPQLLTPAMLKELK